MRERSIIKKLRLLGPCRGLGGCCRFPVRDEMVRTKG
jgi:hypothetical protein